MIVVLAGSFAETAAFAAQQGLRNTPHITNRDKLRGLRPTKVHLLPGYWARRDIHAINAELKRMSRDRSNPEVIEWDKIEGTFTEVGVEAAETYGVTPEAKIALVSAAPKVIEDVQASQVAALAAGRLDALEELAADVDDADDTDDFFAMMDGVGSDG